MILLGIFTWFGIIVTITSIILTFVWDDSCLAIFALGCVIILLGCVIGLYDFGQLPAPFDWFERLLMNLIEGW